MESQNLSRSKRGHVHFQVDLVQRRKRDLQFSRRDTILCENEVDGLRKAARLTVGRYDLERRRLVKERDSLRRRNNTGKDAKLLSENRVENCEDRIGDGAEDNVAKLIVKYRTLQISQMRKSDHCYGRVGSIHAKGTSQIGVRFNQRAKSAPKTLVKPEGRPMSKTRIEELATPAPYISRDFRNKTRVLRPRSISQLKSLPKQEYLELVARRPSTTHSGSSIEHFESPSESQAEHSSSNSKFDKSKTRSGFRPSTTPRSLKGTGTGSAVKPLAKELNSTCRYLYSYVEDDTLAVGDIFSNEDFVGKRS